MLMTYIHNCVTVYKLYTVRNGTGKIMILDSKSTLTDNTVHSLIHINKRLAKFNVDVVIQIIPYTIIERQIILFSPTSLSLSVFVSVCVSTCLSVSVSICLILCLSLSPPPPLS